MAPAEDRGDQSSLEGVLTQKGEKKSCCLATAHREEQAHVGYYCGVLLLMPTEEERGARILARCQVLAHDHGRRGVGGLQLVLDGACISDIGSRKVLDGCWLLLE